MIQDIKLGTEGIENISEESRQNAIELVERTIKLIEKGEEAEKILCRRCNNDKFKLKDQGDMIMLVCCNCKRCYHFDKEKDIYWD